LDKGGYFGCPSTDVKLSHESVVMSHVYMGKFLNIHE
ncbi:hypothetical protein J567_4412, partial [Acinetobacter baumannii 754286]